MNEIKKKQYQELKNNNYNCVIERKWKSNILLQECLAVLGNNKNIISIEQQQPILDDFNNILPQIIKSNKRKKIQSIQELLPHWEKKSVYIIWDEDDLPIVQIDFKYVVDHIDDVSAVAFETWIVAVEMNEFIQFDARNRISEINLEGDE